MRGKIVSNTSKHGFKIGETVVIIAKHDTDGDYLCYSLEDSTRDWWVTPRDIKLEE